MRPTPIFPIPDLLVISSSGSLLPNFSDFTCVVYDLGAFPHYLTAQGQAFASTIGSTCLWVC